MQVALPLNLVMFEPWKSRPQYTWSLDRRERPFKRASLPRLHQVSWALRSRFNLHLAFAFYRCLHSVNAATSCFDL